jgi:putative transposase
LKPISYKRHRFLPEVIRHAVWLYFRFTLSFRDVEELLAQRGIEVSYETIRCWTLKFGGLFARNLRRRRPTPTGRWHLDEMVVKIRGRRMLLWRAVDEEGEVLDVLVQKRRNKAAALKILRKLLKNQGIHPETIVTDGLASYPAAMRILGCKDRQRPDPKARRNAALPAALLAGPESHRAGLRQAQIPAEKRRRNHHDRLVDRIGNILKAFTPQECANYFRHDGYAST